MPRRFATLVETVILSGMRRLRGFKSLVHEAVDLTTDLVREGHDSWARGVLGALELVPEAHGVASELDGLRRKATDRVLGAIRDVNGSVRTWTDAALDAATPACSPPEVAVPLRSNELGSWPWLVDAGLGVLNGSIGDHLHAQENELGLGLELRLGEAYLPQAPSALGEALQGVAPKLAVFVHGLGATEWSWCYEGEAYHGDGTASFATLLERELGYTPLLVRYNTGRHVSESGRLLAHALERVVAAWPTPLAHIVLIGHSMGGLVVRSACHYAEQNGASWVERVSHVFCLGAPHRGAPLEKLGHLATWMLQGIDTPATRIVGRLAASRSAGVKDMRLGLLVDEDWLGRDPDLLANSVVTAVPLLAYARYYFISATITEDPLHPLGRLVGDLVVRVPSSSGPAVEQHTFPIETRNYGGVLHHQLQNHPAVYQQIRQALSRTS